MSTNSDGGMEEIEKKTCGTNQSSASSKYLSSGGITELQNSVSNDMSLCPTISKVPLCFISKMNVCI